MLKKRLKEPFGKAGLIVAVVALVFAMLGGAYAATGGSGKATASAKAKQGKQGKPGKTGPAGPAGPAGAPGAKGDTGAAGSNGANGTNGTNGTSVTTAAASGTECPSGGIKVMSASPTTKVCNGTTGFTETLPSGKTETGYLTASTHDEGLVLAPISLSIPLAAPLPEANTHFVTAEEVTNQTAPAECPGSSTSPEASGGSLCAYEIEVSGLTFGGFAQSTTAGFRAAFVAAADTPGGFGAHAQATWAVTAE